MLSAFDYISHSQAGMPDCIGYRCTGWPEHNITVQKHLNSEGPENAPKYALRDPKVKQIQEKQSRVWLKHDGQLKHAKSRHLRPEEERRDRYDVTAGAGDSRRAHKTCQLQPHQIALVINATWSHGGTDGTAET